MEKFNIFNRLFHFFYKQIFLRFSGEIRNPYLITVDDIYTNDKTNQLDLSFHIANKRNSTTWPVAKFVASDMIYLIDPKVAFYLGNQFGSHAEKLRLMSREKLTAKHKVISGIKRVFIDE